VYVSEKIVPKVSLEDSEEEDDSEPDECDDDARSDCNEDDDSQEQEQVLVKGKDSKVNPSAGNKNPPVTQLPDDDDDDDTGETDEDETDENVTNEKDDTEEDDDETDEDVTKEEPVRPAKTPAVTAGKTTSIPAKKQETPKQQEVKGKVKTPEPKDEPKEKEKVQPKAKPAVKKEEPKKTVKQEPETKTVKQEPEAKKKGKTVVDSEESDEDSSEQFKSRSQIEEILKLHEIGSKSDLEEKTLITTTFKDLKKIYESSIKPLEVQYKYKFISTRLITDAEIFSKPMVLFLGAKSSGKTSLVNYLLGIESTPWQLQTGQWFCFIFR